MRDATWYVFLDLVLRIVTAVTIPIAVWSLRTTWRTHLERSTFEMVDRMYSLCHILQDHVQRDWRVAHLHCIGKVPYYRTAAIIKKRCSSGGRNETGVSDGRIAERQFVIRILMVYEQIYLQWIETDESHKRRKVFLKAMLDYFVKRLIPNPRTLAYLDADPCGLTLHMEKDSAEYLTANLRRDGILPDHMGPFEFDPVLEFHSPPKNGDSPT